MSESPAASSPTPDVTEIPLPPGMTLDQFMTLQGQEVTIAISLAVAFGIMLWDYLSLLPDEVSLYRSTDKRLWRTPATWLFIILRYSGIIATLPALFFSSVQSQHCQVAVILSQLGVCLAVFSSGAIFSFRVFAIWSANRAVYALVLLVFLLMLSCWIAAASQYNATTGPATPFASNCKMLPILSWAPISFASSVLFDTTILVLTLAKLRRNLVAKSLVGRQIFRDTLMYFTLTTVTNIVVFSIQMLGSAHEMMKPAAVPYSTVMTVTMGSRVYLNLRLLEQRRQTEPDNIPLGVPRGQDSAVSAALAHYGQTDATRPSGQFTVSGPALWEKAELGPYIGPSIGK